MKINFIITTFRIVNYLDANLRANPCKGKLNRKSPKKMFLLTQYTNRLLSRKIDQVSICINNKNIISFFDIKRKKYFILVNKK